MSAAVTEQSPAPEAAEPPDTGAATDRHRLTALQGLAALSLDAMASVAYGPEAIVLVLAAAGAHGLGFTLPVTLAIAALLAVLVASYRQVIAAFPDGGGSYAVAKTPPRPPHQPGGGGLADPGLRAQRRGVRHRRRGRAHLGLPRALRRPGVAVPGRARPGHRGEPARHRRLRARPSCTDRRVRRARSSRSSSSGSSASAPAATAAAARPRLRSSRSTPPASARCCCSRRSRPAARR